MIRKDSLERLTDDLEQLINFFVIEFQRVVFVENLYVSGAVSIESSPVAVFGGMLTC